MSDRIEVLYDCDECETHGADTMFCTCCVPVEFVPVSEIERLTAEVAEKNKRIEELEKAISDVHSTLVGCILIQRDGDPPLFTMWLDGHVLTPDLTNYVIIPAERYGETLQNGDGTLVGVQREPITHRLEGHATISLKKLTGERDE